MFHLSGTAFVLAFALVSASCSPMMNPTDANPDGYEVQDDGASEATPNDVDADTGVPCDGTSIAPDDAGNSAEYAAFDQGLCYGTCMLLRNCGVLCQSLDPAPSPCDNNSLMTFETCLHGGLRSSLFGVAACPHACPAGTAYVGATTCDTQRCAADLHAPTCTVSEFRAIFTSPPPSCLQPCR